VLFTKDGLSAVIVFMQILTISNLPNEIIIEFLD